jgi:hypothetical protein
MIAAVEECYSLSHHQTTGEVELWLRDVGFRLRYFG